MEFVSILSKIIFLNPLGLIVTMITNFKALFTVFNLKLLLRGMTHPLVCVFPFGDLYSS